MRDPPIPQIVVYTVHFPQLNRLTDSACVSEINICVAEFSHNKLRHFVVSQLSDTVSVFLARVDANNYGT